MSEDTYKCQRCGDDSDDLRTLWHACLYDMNELNVPFRQRQIHGQLMAHIGDETVELLGRKRTVAKFDNIPDVPPRKYPFYTLRVCKSCRGSWMAAIEHWFQHVIPDPSPGTGIFVRRNGANVEITEEEFYAARQKVADSQAQPPD